MKYFTLTEISCPCCGNSAVVSDLSNKMDKLRGALGKPIYVNSGFRCKKENKRVGGKPNSEHLTGQAWDIRVNKKKGTPMSSRDRYMIQKIAYALEFPRIGTYDTFIHLGVSTDHPQDVNWLGT